MEYVSVYIKIISHIISIKPNLIYYALLKPKWINTLLINNLFMCLGIMDIGISVNVLLDTLELLCLLNTSLLELSKV